MPPGGSEVFRQEVNNFKELMAPTDHLHDDDMSDMVEDYKISEQGGV